MLSRIAESMFWIGRYVERAEDTARLLQTHLRLLVEDTSAAAEVDACRYLLALMSVDHIENPTHADLLRVLGYDRREPTSIYSSWSAAQIGLRLAVQADVGKGDHLEIERLFIEQREIAGNDAGLFERTHAAQAWRG